MIGAAAASLFKGCSLIAMVGLCIIFACIVFHVAGLGLALLWGAFPDNDDEGWNANLHIDIISSAIALIVGVFLMLRLLIWMV